jgi:hypothetical protein
MGGCGVSVGRADIARHPSHRRQEAPTRCAAVRVCTYVSRICVCCASRATGVSELLEGVEAAYRQAKAVARCTCASKLGKTLKRAVALLLYARITWYEHKARLILKAWRSVCTSKGTEMADTRLELSPPKYVDALKSMCDQLPRRKVPLPSAYPATLNMGRRAVLAACQGIHHTSTFELIWRMLA